MNHQPANPVRVPATPAPGPVFLVGAGPGDPGLLTIRGAERLREADVVIYDGLVSRELLRHAPRTAEIIYGGKHDRSRCVSQAELNALLLAKAREGRTVVRLKGGDPYLFGRGGEEAELLAQAGIPFEVVPGVSSVHSVPCFAGIPLTHREHSSRLTVVTGHEAPGSPDDKQDWACLARAAGTLVVLMGLKHLRQSAAALVAHGRSASTPAAAISRGTTPHQRTVTGTLATIADQVDDAGLRSPALTVIGEVVALREQLDWFERRPLMGRRVVVTQRADLAAAQVALLRAQGAEVLEVPATRWGAHPDRESLDRAIARLGSYDWILFSNPVGIDQFLTRFMELHGDLRELGPARLGAYGPRCAEKLRQWRLKPAAAAADHKTPLILDAVLKCGEVKGRRFLILRGDGALESVPEALLEQGADVDVVPCFAVEPQTEDPCGHAATLLEHGADWILFASGLAIDHFHARFGLPQLLERFPQMRLAIASPTMQWALDQFGLKPHVTGIPDDIEALTRAIIEAELGAGPRPSHDIRAVANSGEPCRLDAE